MVEALAAAFERLPQRRYLTLLLVSGRAEPFARSFTSQAAMGTGRELMKRSDVDWIAAGYDERELEELVEYMLRSLQSLVIDPPDPAPTGPELRNYLRRWIAPTVVPRSKEERQMRASHGPRRPRRRHRGQGGHACRSRRCSPGEVRASRCARAR